MQLDALPRATPFIILLHLKALHPHTQFPITFTDSFRHIHISVRKLHPLLLGLFLPLLLFLLIIHLSHTIRTHYNLQQKIKLPHQFFPSPTSSTILTPILWFLRRKEPGRGRRREKHLDRHPISPIIRVSINQVFKERRHPEPIVRDVCLCLTPLPEKSRTAGVKYTNSVERWLVGKHSAPACFWANEHYSSRGIVLPGKIG